MSHTAYLKSALRKRLNVTKNTCLFSTDSK